MGLKDFVRLSVASGVMTWYVLLCHSFHT
jgi:hypothetical protein